MPNRLYGIRILDGMDEWMDPIVLSIHSNNHHSTIYEKYHSAIHKSPILPTNTPQSTILSILNRNRRHLSLFRLAQPLHVRQSPSLQHTHLLLISPHALQQRLHGNHASHQLPRSPPPSHTSPVPDPFPRDPASSPPSLHSTFPPLPT